MDLATIYAKYPTEDTCIDHIETIRWPNNPVCPYCSSTRSTRVSKEQRHHCNACNTSFSATVGTIIHSTHLPLQKWFLALRLTLGAKTALSARQLAGDLDVSKNTAWRIAMKIREGIANPEQRDLLARLIEADEIPVARWQSPDD